jgi:hypothetical protein
MRKVVMICGILTVAAIAGREFGNYLAPPPKKNHSSKSAIHSLASELEIAAGSLQLGDLWESNSHIHSLILKNKGNADALINKWELTCNCASVKPDRISIPAQGEAKITLDLDLRIPAKAERENEYPFVVHLRPIGENHKSLGDFQIRGVVRRVLTAEKQAMYFAPQTLSGQSNAVCQLELKPQIDLESIQITSTSLAIETRIMGRDFRKGSSVQVEARLVHPLPVGDFSAKLVARGIRKGELLPEITIPIQGMILGDVVADPNVVLLGLREKGEEISSQVLITSSVGEIVSVRQNGTDANCKLVDTRLIGSTGALRIRTRITTEEFEKTTVRLLVKVQSKTEEVPVEFDVVSRGITK